MSSSDFSTGTNPGRGGGAGGFDDVDEGGLLSLVVPLMWNAMTVVVALAAMVAGLLYVKQDSLLYYPEIGGIPRRPGDNPRRYRSPDEHQVPYENLMIRCEDGVRIHSWLMLRKQQQQSTATTKMPTIVFFHGNAGNIGLRLPNALQMLQYLDAHVLMVEYRGYGDSDDALVNEAGLKLDAEAALRFIRTHPAVDPDQIYLFGRSLGGSVAFHLAQYAETNNIPIAGVMVENTFLSIAAMVDTLMPYVAPFKSLILRIGWRSNLIVPHLKSPVLYLAGARDELVPHQHMLELYKKTKQSRLSKIHIIENGTHNESWLQGGTEYWSEMKEFMMEATAGTGGDPSSPSAAATTEQQQQSTPHTVEKLSSASAVKEQIGSPSTSSSIPLMPKKLVNMLSEAVTGGGSKDKQTPQKKEN